MDLAEAKHIIRPYIFDSFHTRMVSVRGCIETYPYTISYRSKIAGKKLLYFILVLDDIISFL